MNRLQLLNNVKSRCGISQESQFDADILLFLNDGQREVSSRSLWKFMQTVEAITTVSGTHIYPLANASSVMDVRDTTNKISLVADDTIDFDRWYPNQTGTGISTRYRVFGASKASDSAETLPMIQLYPIPGGAYSISVREYADLADLSADTSVSRIPSRYHLLLVHYACAAHLSSRGDARANEHETRFENVLAAMAEQLGSDPADLVHVLRGENESDSGDILRYPSTYPNG